MGDSEKALSAGECLCCELIRNADRKVSTAGLCQLQWKVTQGNLFQNAPKLRFALLEVQYGSFKEKQYCNVYLNKMLHHPPTESTAFSY